MAYWIRESRRVTITKYLVEADSPDDDDFGDGEQYLGYVDVDSDDDGKVHGPFDSEEEALNDSHAYVDGR